MALIKQNKSAKVNKMTPKHRSGGEALKPGAGSTAVKFEGTVVKGNAGVGVTSPAAKNAGSHDDKVRTHGAD